jgi:hypothetical protein
VFAGAEKFFCFPYETKNALGGALEATIYWPRNLTKIISCLTSKKGPIPVLTCRQMIHMFRLDSS